MPGPIAAEFPKRKETRLLGGREGIDQVGWGGNIGVQDIVHASGPC